MRRGTNGCGNLGVGVWVGGGCGWVWEGEKGCEWA